MFCVQVVGVVQNIFSLEHAVPALGALKTGHTQGKTVVSMLPLEQLEALPEGERVLLLEAGRRLSTQQQPPPKEKEEVAGEQEEQQLEGTADDQPDRAPPKQTPADRQEHQQ